MSKSGGLQAPVRPGEILLEDFMKPLNLTLNRLALELHVPATRIASSESKEDGSVKTWELHKKPK